MSYDKWHSLHASLFLPPPSRFLLLHSRCLMTNGIHVMRLSSSLLHLDFFYCTLDVYDKWHSIHASFFLPPPSRFLLLHSRCLMTNGIHFMLLSSSLLYLDFFYCTQDVL
ncbi:hypothetical protein P8452_65811 [Trifolium repens]|nr:hypothetical protein P8452_65809 [Trifolium repens]WJX83129.1 hypothetical protein P8452_65811 [Trifolium repens]